MAGLSDLQLLDEVKDYSDLYRITKALNELHNRRGSLYDALSPEDQRKVNNIRRESDLVDIMYRNSAALQIPALKKDVLARRINYAREIGHTQGRTDSIPTLADIDEARKVYDEKKDANLEKAESDLNTVKDAHKQAKDEHKKEKRSNRWKFVKLAFSALVFTGVLGLVGSAIGVFSGLLATPLAIATGSSIASFAIAAGGIAWMFTRGISWLKNKIKDYKDSWDSRKAKAKVRKEKKKEVRKAKSVIKTIERQNIRDNAYLEAYPYPGETLYSSAISTFSWSDPRREASATHEAEADRTPEVEAAHTAEPTHETEPARAPEEEPVHEAEPIHEEEPAPVVEPIREEEPAPVVEPIREEEPAPVVEPIHEEEPAPVAEPIPVEEVIRERTGLIDNPIIGESVIEGTLSEKDEEKKEPSVVEVVVDSVEVDLDKLAEEYYESGDETILKDLTNAQRIIVDKTVSAIKKSRIIPKKSKIIEEKTVNNPDIKNSDAKYYRENNNYEPGSGSMADSYIDKLLASKAVKKEAEVTDKKDVKAEVAVEKGEDDKKATTKKPSKKTTPKAKKATSKKVPTDVKVEDNKAENDKKVTANKAPKNSTSKTKTESNKKVVEAEKKEPIKESSTKTNKEKIVKAPAKTSTPRKKKASKVVAQQIEPITLNRYNDDTRYQPDSNSVSDRAFERILTQKRQEELNSQKPTTKSNNTKKTAVKNNDVKKPEAKNNNAKYYGENNLYEPESGSMADTYIDKLLTERRIEETKGIALDDQMNDAVRVVKENGTASIGLIQKEFKVGYMQAKAIIDRMVSSGLVENTEEKHKKVNKMTPEIYDKLAKSAIQEDEDSIER